MRAAAAAVPRVVPARNAVRRWAAALVVRRRLAVRVVLTAGTLRALRVPSARAVPLALAPVAVAVAAVTTVAVAARGVAAVAAAASLAPGPPQSRSRRASRLATAWSLSRGAVAVRYAARPMVFVIVPKFVTARARHVPPTRCCPQAEAAPLACRVAVAMAAAELPASAATPLTWLRGRPTPSPPAPITPAIRTSSSLALAPVPTTTSVAPVRSAPARLPAPVSPRSAPRAFRLPLRLGTTP